MTTNVFIIYATSGYREKGPIIQTNRTKGEMYFTWGKVNCQHYLLGEISLFSFHQCSNLFRIYSFLIYITSVNKQLVPIISLVNLYLRGGKLYRLLVEKLFYLLPSCCITSHRLTRIWKISTNIYEINCSTQISNSNYVYII